MNINFVIERLPRLEFAGDWHDRPIKWVARTPEPGFTQKFSTKKSAELWVRAVRRSSTFNEACRIFQQYP